MLGLIFDSIYCWKLSVVVKIEFYEIFRIFVSSIINLFGIAFEIRLLDF